MLGVRLPNAQPLGLRKQSSQSHKVSCSHCGWQGHLERGKSFGKILEVWLLLEQEAGQAIAVMHGGLRSRASSCARTMMHWDLEEGTL